MADVTVIGILHSSHIPDHESFRALRLSRPETQGNDDPRPVSGSPYLEVDGDSAFLHGMPDGWANVWGYRRCLTDDLDGVRDWDVIRFGGRNLVVSPTVRQLLLAGRVWVNTHHRKGFPAAFVVSEM